MHIYRLEFPRSDGSTSIYIGQSKFTPEESTDYWGSGNFCKDYVKRHGKEKVREIVKRTILLRDLPNQEALNYWEIFAIADYKDRFGDKVVNQAKGGEGGDTGPCTDETRVKRSKAIKEAWKSEEFRAKHKKAMKKVMENDEYRAKISKSSKKMWECPEFRSKQKKVMEKVWKSPEWRAKQSKAHRGSNNANYNINSIKQVYGRAFASGDIKIVYAVFCRALKNPKHPKHDKYTKLYNKHLIKED